MCEKNDKDESTGDETGNEIGEESREEIDNISVRSGRSDKNNQKYARSAQNSVYRNKL